MQRWCSKFRALAHLPTSIRPSTSSISLYRSYHAASSFQRPFSSFSSISSQLYSHFNASASLLLPRNGISFSAFSPSYAQLRNFSAKSKEKKWKKLTPAVSRVKKIKMKGYSSYKGRFRTLNDGTIRRWREGKRHNAHLKSKEAKRRLRKPALVHAAYATVMKKLNFCSN
ncbi:50S ribosomal protein L35 [Bienertia sinuspersici]